MPDIHDIHWYVQEFKKGSVEDIVSHMPEVRRAVGGMAQGMGREAAALLSVHVRKGNAHIEVQGAPPRKLDWYVMLKDIDPGGEGKSGKNRADRSVMSIEFGWTTKKGTEVAGLHILGSVMKRAARRYRG